MAYESPIDVNFMEPFIEEITNARENAITAKISEVYGVSVNKEELAKALAFDRGQYEKGYADAMAAMSGTVAELNRLNSLEFHGDTCEKGGWLFQYHEMAGMYTITIVNAENFSFMHEYNIKSTLSHDDFVAWCNAYIMHYKEKEDGSRDK